jgi:hypothetical protein
MVDSTPIFHAAAFDPETVVTSHGQAHYRVRAARRP